MDIRDIVNRNIVNLSNCDEEPIHIPGTIQPHGCLLAISYPDLLVQFCSGNTKEYLGIDYQTLLGKTLHSFFSEVDILSLQNGITAIANGLTAQAFVNFLNTKYHLLIHPSDDLWILEFEPLMYQPTAPSIFDQTVHFVKFMEQSQTLKQLCQKIAGEIRTVTGYDRVMVYRFDKDYNGEVFSEAKRDDLESFLGLHYPHTDIPVQARQLYIKNLLRIIPDMAYKPVPIYTLNNGIGKNLDLSLSALRSVSPIHVQYLQNMGVEATLTISLLLENRLWGLIACHHYSHKYLDNTTRINARLQGHFLTSQINVRQQAESFDQSKEVNAALETLLNQQFSPTRDSLALIVQQPQLLALCNATGVAIFFDDELYVNGLVPQGKELYKLINWASLHVKQGVFSSSKLCDDYPEAITIAHEAAGLISYTLTASSTACVLWFNAETVEEVHWGGNPEKAIIKDENGLHPRKSFERWKQTVKHQARQWTTVELSAATSYAYALQKHVSLILLTEEEARQRKLSEQLKEINEELENINWISTHDLKEPLRKIRIYSTRLLDKEKDLSVDAVQSLNRMNQSAGRMQQLISDLTSFGKLGRNPESFHDINLFDLINLIKTEREDVLTEKGAKIIVHVLPVIKGVPVLIKQLLINIIENALKFSKASVIPEIRIESHNEIQNEEGSLKKYYVVTIADNGIGFDNKFNKDIFKIFNRLHLKTEYEGSGIGLALCKKIIQMHGGFIAAEGRPDEGASFSLYFPADK